jgi:hypothetical protein
MIGAVSSRGSWNRTRRPNVAKAPELRASCDSIPRQTHMDTTTLLIIVILVLLLGGGWYGRGRWY